MIRRAALICAIALWPGLAAANGCYINDGLGWVLAKAAKGQRLLHEVSAPEIAPDLVALAEAEACAMSAQDRFGTPFAPRETTAFTAPSGQNYCDIAIVRGRDERNPRIVFADWTSDPARNGWLTAPDLGAIGAAVVPQKDGKGPWYAMVLARPCN